MGRYRDYPALFQLVRTKPGMFLGTPSITAWELFLSGLHFAEDLYRVPQDRQLSGFDFAAFEKWADVRFNPERLSINSFHMARDATDAESAAFYRWFEWYDQFMHEGKGKP